MIDVNHTYEFMIISKGHGIYHSPNICNIMQTFPHYSTEFFIDTYTVPLTKRCYINQPCSKKQVSFLKFDWSTNSSYIGYNERFACQIAWEEQSYSRSKELKLPRFWGRGPSSWLSSNTLENIVLSRLYIFLSCFIN